MCKEPYKRGWTKEEHMLFLKGLQYHGKGSWKDIASIVGSRSPSQIQVHAHRVNKHIYMCVDIFIVFSAATERKESKKKYS